MKRIQKRIPPVSYEAFKLLAGRLTHVVSSHGVRYDVARITDTEIHFERRGANKSFYWFCDLYNLYRAYSELNSFENSKAFRNYIPDKYLEARNLLFALGMLELE